MHFLELYLGNKDHTDQFGKKTSPQKLCPLPSPFSLVDFAPSCRRKDKPLASVSSYLSPGKDQQDRPKAKLSSGKTWHVSGNSSFSAPSQPGVILPSPPPSKILLYKKKNLRIFITRL